MDELKKEMTKKSKFLTQMEAVCVCLETKYERQGEEARGGGVGEELERAG